MVANNYNLYITRYTYTTIQVITHWLNNIPMIE